MEVNESHINFENLYPALITCFTIILMGYISGRFNLITTTEAKGISTFIGYFSLPSLIFVNMVTMDLSAVNWKFLLAILISKAIIFFTVMIMHTLLIRPTQKGTAGLLAIFCTQSNDFAVGYPIVKALYSNTYPDFDRYIYLIAPINLAILNPIGFALMQYQKDESIQNMLPSEAVGARSFSSRLYFIWGIIRSILKNPIIFMTVLGIVGNFIFHHSLSVYVEGMLTVLGQAFASCALFTLGLRMVGKVHTLQGGRLVVPGLLISAKLLALPIVTREIVNLLNCGVDEQDTSEWSTFGFLYGTLPSAPTVFVFATQYGIEQDLIATTMVLCTFVSAPWIFVSAKMITLSTTDPSQYLKQLSSYAVDLSYFSIVASLWVLVVFILTKKIKKVPHKFTICLVVSQILSCIGAIMFKFVDRNINAWAYIQFSFFTFGVFSGRIWTAIIAITLVFMECRSLCFILLKLQPVFMVFGWGLPCLLNILLLLVDMKKISPNENQNPNFLYGSLQAIIAVSLLVLCFVVTAGCLVIHEMYRRRRANYWDLVHDVSDETRPVTECARLSNPEIGSDEDGNCCCGSANKCAILPTINESAENSPNPPVVDIEDLFGVSSRLRGGEASYQSENNYCPTGFDCKGDSKEYCQGIIRQYDEPIDDDLELIEEEESTHDPQVLRHMVLLILLLCSMFIGIAVSIWTVVMEKMSGIYIELSFLDVTLNFGQSILVFGVFGTDTKDVLLPILKRWRKLWCSSNKLILPMLSELSGETLFTCEQFKTHHLTKCRQDIETTKRWRLRVYEQVFSGRRFVDWLIEVGLAHDRIEAVNYSRHLLEGRIIRHINDVYHFYDKNLLYTFN